MLSRTISYEPPNSYPNPFTYASKSGSLYFANVQDYNKLSKGKLEIKVPYDKKNPYSVEVYNMKIDDKFLK